MVTVLSFLASVVVLLLLCGKRRRWALQRPKRRWAWAAPPALLVLAFALTPSILAQKVVAGLLMPAGLLWLALLALAAVTLLRQQADASKQERRMAASACLLFAGYWVMGSGATASALTGWHQRPFASARLAQTGPFDALLVLGGATSTRPSGEVQVSISGGRLVTAARLFRRGASRFIVCGGTPLVGEQLTDERSGAWQARQLLIELGVPPGSILMVRGRNTSEEISSFAELLRERSWQRVGLLTSAWHMRRAMRLAQRASFSPAAVPADFRGGAPLSWRRANLPELLPSEESLWRVRLVFWEWLGMLVGR